MKAITISDFETLVKHCLTTPHDFANKSIVLWNADIHPIGIARRVIKQCCLSYNKNNPDRQVWESYSDGTDDITEIKEHRVESEGGHIKSYGVFTQGVLVTECLLPMEINDWVTFVNTHENAIGHLSNDWVLIAFANGNAFDLNEQMFSSNCDIYSIQPSDENEWGTWISQFYSRNIINSILAYIKEKKPAVSFDQWTRIVHNINLKLGGEKYKTLKQIPERSLSLLIKGDSSINLDTKDFWEFIQSM